MSREHLDHQYDNPIYTFKTIDSGLGFVYSKNYSQVSAELEPSLYIYVSFFNPEINKFTDPFIIYQTAKPQNSTSINLRAAMCSPDFLGVGYQCVLQLINITSVDSSNNGYGKNVVLLVSFLSSGSVTGIKKLTGNFESADLVIRTPLPEGGYLLMHRNRLSDGCLIGGDIYDPADKFNKIWDIPDNFVIPLPCIVIYNHGARRFEIISDIKPNNFSITYSDITGFGYFDGEYIYIESIHI